MLGWTAGAGGGGVVAAAGALTGSAGAASGFATDVAGAVGALAAPGAAAVDVPRLAAQRLTAEPMRLAQATQPPAGPAAGAGAAPASQRIELAVLLTGRPMQVGFRGWAPRSVAAAAARPQPAPGSAAQPAMPVAPAHWRILPTAHWPPRSAFPRRSFVPSFPCARRR